MAEQLIDSYSESNQNNSVELYGDYWGVGQSFTGNGLPITSAKFYLSKDGSPTGNCYAKIYAHTGTFGTSSKPTGSPLATSDAVNVSTIGESPSLVTFTFSGANQITLVDGTKYVIIFYYDGGGGGENFPYIYFDSSSPTHNGNRCFYEEEEWISTSTSDLCFYVYGEEAIPPDTTPPVITLLGNATVNVEVGSSYVDAGATALDETDGDITENIVVGGDAVDAETVGAYVITYNVSDAALNSATQVTRTVNVVDTTSPVITIIGEEIINLTVGDVYEDAGASALDNYDGDITGDIVTINPVNTAVADTYTITYNVSDSSDNAADEVTRTVIVSKKKIKKNPFKIFFM